MTTAQAKLAVQRSNDAVDRHIRAQQDRIQKLQEQRKEETKRESRSFIGRIVQNMAV